MDVRKLDMELVGRLRSSDTALSHAAIRIEQLWQTNDAISKDYDIVRKEVEQLTKLLAAQRADQRKARFGCGILGVLAPAVAIYVALHIPPDTAGMFAGMGFVVSILGSLGVTFFAWVAGLCDWNDATLPED